MALDKETLDGLRIDRPRGDRGRRKPFLPVAIIGAVIAVIVAVFLTRGGGAAEVTVAPARVVSGEARGAVLNASGYVTARRQATVSSKVTGKVVEIMIEEGMRVASGQVLARLDPSFASRGMAVSRAEAAAAQSALAETRVRIREAELQLSRAANLQRQGISSSADRDRARAEVDSLRARLAAQSDGLRVAREQQNLQQQNVDDTVIRAPFEGIVVSKDAQPGEMISPVSAGGGFTRTGICTIVDMESLEIEVDVNEAYINRVSPGQQVEAILDAYPDWKVPCRVITAVPTANREKATVRVRIAFDRKDPRILPDMGVKVSFITPATTAAVSTTVEVPKAAIRRDGEQDIVFVMRDDKAERRAIRVSMAQGDLVRVASGLTGTEQVIIGGPAELKDGDKVRVASK